MATAAPTGTQTNGAPSAADSKSAPDAKKPNTAISRAADQGGALNAFASIGNFVDSQRMALALSESTLVPVAYRGNVPNCMIALELASRMSASVFAIMQNLDIIQGKPSFGAKFLIGTVNASKRFSPIRFRWNGKPFTQEWGCRAWATDLESGEELVGPLVDMVMAKDEGWLGKSGSKWKTLPELMLMYRSAAFWTRVYCPEMSLGLGTTEEMEDVRGVSVEQMEVRPPALGSIGNPAELESSLLADVQRDDPPKIHDAIIEEPKEAPEKRPKRAAASKQDALPGEPPIGVLADDAPMPGTSPQRDPGSEG